MPTEWRRPGVMVNSGAMRADDGEDLLAGYLSGPAAATEATAVALARADAAGAVVLVEGISDQIAVETLAGRRGRDLAAEGIVVLPVGGAHGVARYLRRFGPEGTGARLAGLCDAGEAHVVQRGLAAAGLGAPGSRADLERLGFFVCVEDLEDELIRAAGPAEVMEVFAAHGDLGAFRTIQRQPAWRGKDEAAQLRRFLGAGGQRKLRYARLLTEAIDLDRIPRPLTALLTAV
ncbi:TOPRIM nucleotidyl transferase/hydrolase domain-containing protein [Amycolatopsis taiwanensis]|nr:TOPRIM nucleotidyl transferase/hydrolase domain-containing protein [Amycolatopsis taiwanensis]